VARRRRAEPVCACGALVRPRAARSTQTLGIIQQAEYSGMDSSNFSHVASAAVAWLQRPRSPLPALPFVLSRPRSPYRRTISSLSVDPVASGYRRTGSARMLPNYAFERTGKSLAVGAAGASEHFAPAAPGNCRRAAAQRRR
jgi:hypothetical protein